RLEGLWPTAFSSGGRRWVLANVHDGVLDEAAAQLGLDLDPAAHAGRVLNARGSLRYHDLTINYLNGLPPVRKVNGTAKFADEELVFYPTAGSLKGLKVTGGTLQLSNLGEHVEWLTIDLAIAGPLQDALEVIDSKPLQYAHAIGIDPARAAGRADTQLHFRLPLLADLKAEALDFGAKTTITGASIDKLALERGISEGNLALDLARTGAHLQGTAKLDGVPSRIEAN